jgi:hypothetical protein
LATNADAYSKAFGTFLEPKRVSLSNSLTSQKTERSLTANSLRLQTSQKRKGTCPASRGRRQARILWRCRHFHADITTFKILIDSTLSTEDAAMMMMAIKNYYLGTPMQRFEYMKMLLSRFPEEIIQKYNLNALAVEGLVYI